MRCKSCCRCAPARYISHFPPSCCHHAALHHTTVPAHAETQPPCGLGEMGPNPSPNCWRCASCCTCTPDRRASFPLHAAAAGATSASSRRPGTCSVNRGRNIVRAGAGGGIFQSPAFAAAVRCTHRHVHLRYQSYGTVAGAGGGIFQSPAFAAAVRRTHRQVHLQCQSDGTVAGAGRGCAADISRYAARQPQVQRAGGAALRCLLQRRIRRGMLLF